MHGQAKLDDPFRATNGFVVNQHHIKEQQEIGRFQSAHSSYLSKPKKVASKFETISNYCTVKSNLKSSSNLLKRSSNRFRSSSTINVGAPHFRSAL